MKTEGHEVNPITFLTIPVVTQERSPYPTRFMYYCLTTRTM